MKKTRRWIYWIKLIVGLVLIAYLYHKVNERDSIIAAFRHTDWTNISICILLLIPNMLLAFFKWRFLLRRHFQDIADRDIFGSLLFGYTLGLVTPGRLGELGRGLFFQNHDIVETTGLNVVDKLANQLVIVTLGWLSLTIFITHYTFWQFSYATTMLVCGWAVLAVIWSVFVHPDALRGKLRAWFTRERHPKIARFVNAFRHIHRRESLVVLAMTIAWYGVIIFQYHVLVRAFTPVPLHQSFLAVTATLFVKTLLPLTFGDLGIREGVSIFFYSNFAISEAAVFNASMLIFIINFLTPALCGIYYVFRLRALKNGRATGMLPLVADAPPRPTEPDANG